MRSVIAKSKGIICLDNPEVYEELKKLFPGKVILNSTNGVNVEKYYASEEKVCDGIFVGNYGERKGSKYLFQIWDKVNERINAKLCIIGKGWSEIPKNSVYYGFVSEMLCGFVQFLLKLTLSLLLNQLLILNLRKFNELNIQEN